MTASVTLMCLIDTKHQNVLNERGKQPRGATKVRIKGDVFLKGFIDTSMRLSSLADRDNSGTNHTSS